MALRLALPVAESDRLACGAAQPTFRELPHSNVAVTVGFYNVGILASAVAGRNFKKVEFKLQADLLKAFDTHKLDIPATREHEVVRLFRKRDPAVLHSLLQ